MVHAQKNTVIYNHSDPLAYFQWVTVWGGVHDSVHMLKCGYSKREKKATQQEELFIR